MPKKISQEAADDPGQCDGNKRGDLVTYIFNSVEDEWLFISSTLDDKKKLEYIEDAEAAADAFFLAMGTESNFVYISPKSISKAFQKYAKNLLAYKEAEVIVPLIKSHLISEDFLHDSKAFISFITKAKQYKRIVLLSYCASPQIYNLKANLEKVGLTVYAPELPEVDCAWTVNFFGSKSGIRQLAQKSIAAEPDFMMSEGLICVGKVDAARIAANSYLKQKGVVIKTNKGSGGSGVLIFRENELPNNYDECVLKILEWMNGDAYWDNYPIVIENLINATNSPTSMPNVEFKIHKNGHLEMLYVCACQVTPKGVFYGVDINEDIINDRLQTRIEDTCYYIAEQYSAAGYRGHFDVDMMLAKNGHIYVCESNTRNTGGTDTYKLAKKLIGKDFMHDAYTISRSRRNWLPTNSFTFKEVINELTPILYNKKTHEGVVLNSENSLKDGKIIYTIFAKNHHHCYHLEQKLKELLNIHPNFD